MLVALRLLAVAWFDFPTALAILSENGTGSVVVGFVVTTGVPVIGMVSLIGSAMWIAMADRSMWAWAALLAALALNVVLVPLSWFVVVIPLAGVWWFVGRASRHGKSESETPPPQPRTGLKPPWWDDLIPGAFVGLLLMATLLNGSPWLPAEVLTVDSNSKPIVGYMLNDDNDQLVVLTKDKRLIRRYPITSVTDRRVCRAPVSIIAGLSLAARIRNPAEPRPCPTAKKR